MTGISPMQQRAEQKFVVDLLTTLRDDHFSPRAWGRFFQRSWFMSCQTAHDNPPLERSWRRVTCLVALLALLILIGNGLLPLWVGFVMVLRFIIPLVAALLSYLAFASPVRFGSTVWGKYAGLAQCVYFFVLLASTSLSPLVLLLKISLLVVTICLIVVASVAQVVVNMRTRIGAQKTLL